MMMPGGGLPDPAVLDKVENRQIVNGMRALGICLVVLLHTLVSALQLLPGDEKLVFLNGLPFFFNIGFQALGSELVFLFSGFLLSYLLIRERLKTGRIAVWAFYVRRLTRILPLFAFAIFLHVLVSGDTWVEIVFNLLFISQIVGVHTIFAVGWSLEMLVQVYVMLPWVVLALMAARRPLVWLGLAIALSVVVRLGAILFDPSVVDTPLYTTLMRTGNPPMREALYYLLWFRATPFLMGLLMAWLVLLHDDWMRRVFARPLAPGLIVAFATLAIAVTGFLPWFNPSSGLYEAMPRWFWVAFWTGQRFVFTLGVCALVLAMFYARRVWLQPLIFLLRRPLLGVISDHIYSIYLFHITLLGMAAMIVLRTTSMHIPVLGPFTLVTIFLTGLLLSILLADLLTALIERPAQRLLRRWLLPKKAG